MTDLPVVTDLPDATDPTDVTDLPRVTDLPEVGGVSGSGPAGARPRVLVIGSGWRMTSGISYYTCRLANALAGTYPTGAVLMRQLVPARMYPGRARVGVTVNDLEYHQDVEVYDGVDWFWGRSMSGARRMIERFDPDVVVLQWWTGAVLHSYLRLAALAHRSGARVLIEWHEVQDTGEARIPGTVQYVRAAMRPLLRLADAHVVHSQFDLELLRQAYALQPGTYRVVPHGPYDHVLAAPTAGLARSEPAVAARPLPPEPPSAQKPFQLLYFGIIRPYKGVEDLVAAFTALPAQVRDAMELTIVGETWEGWTAPLEAVAASPARDRIRVVNRYVTDAEAREFFAAADAVALPYRRSSASGPLQMAMSAGLPTVVTAVGGLVEAARAYQGAITVPPQDIPALTAALQQLPAMLGQRFEDPVSWEAAVQAYGEIFGSLGLPAGEMVSGTAGAN